MSDVAQQPILGPTKPVPWSHRSIWLAIFAFTAILIALAIYLRPETRGYGTHQQLGLPACSFIILSGMPCPTCGMTTAFADTVRGRLVEAFFAQPAGLVLCLTTMALAAYSLCVVVTGSSVVIRWERISVKLMLGLAFLIVAGWAFKMVYGLATGTLPVH